MTISSQPLTYSTTSSSVGFVAQEIGSVLTDTITISNSGSNYYATGSTFTVATGGGLTSSSGTISIGGLSGTTISIGAGSSWNWKSPEEFVDSFPDFERVKKMCEEYPGLKIAYEKFVTTYKLVKDHYDTPEDQRPLP